MRVLLNIFLIGLLGLSSVNFSYVFAQEEAGLEEAAIDDFEEIESVLGTVISVDLDRSVIVVKISSDEGAQKSPERFTVPVSTMIQKEGAFVKLADLAAEDKVSIEYLENDSGEKIAQMIWVE
ncbi:MAG TPA: hypothetical protein P5160_00630 [Candidatus Omnitrophota bacterium]|nr:hypothetical protein [Candidatus Omnitrophota bacterium]